MQPLDIIPALLATDAATLRDIGEEVLAVISEPVVSKNIPLDEVVAVILAVSPVLLWAAASALHTTAFSSTLRAHSIDAICV